MSHGRGSEGRQDFLSRWSRLKRQGTAGELATVPVTANNLSTASLPAAPLPDTDTLAFSDDFTGFLRQEVEETVRRVALKKLFHSAEFNVMDGLDTYIDDYSIPDPLDEATLRSLNHARELIFDTPADVVTEPVAVLDQIDVEDEVQALPETANV